MLTYHLDPQSKTPLYEQLYRAIRTDIMSGALAGGERAESLDQGVGRGLQHGGARTSRRGLPGRPGAVGGGGRGEGLPD